MGDRLFQTHEARDQAYRDLLAQVWQHRVQNPLRGVVHFAGAGAMTPVEMDIGDIPWVAGGHYYLCPYQDLNSGLAFADHEGRLTWVTSDHTHPSAGSLTLIELSEEQYITFVLSGGLLRESASLPPPKVFRCHLPPKAFRCR